MLKFTDELQEAVRSAKHIASVIGYDCRKEVFLEEKCVWLNLSRFQPEGSPLGEAFALPVNNPDGVVASVKRHFNGTFTVSSHGDDYMVVIPV